MHCSRTIRLLVAMMALSLHGVGVPAGIVHPMLEALRQEAYGDRPDAAVAGDLTSATSIAIGTVSQSVLSKLIQLEDSPSGVIVSTFITTNGAIDLATKYDVQVNSQLGNLFTARVSLAQIESLKNDSNVLLIEPSFFARPMLDYSVVDMGVSSVWSSFGLDGSGVVIGVVDWGIDINNADFKDASGSRICIGPGTLDTKVFVFTTPKWLGSAS